MRTRMWMVGLIVAMLPAVAQAVNLVQNGSFDTDTSGWTAYGSGLQLMWTDQDAALSPFSGSALATVSDNLGGNNVANCVAVGIVGGATYDFSAKVKIPGYAVVAGHTSLFLNWMSGPSCTGTYTGGKSFVSITQQDVWLTVGEQNLTAPAGSQSAQIIMQVTKTGTGGVYHTYLDSVVLASQAVPEVVQHLFLPAGAIKHGLSGTYWTTEGWFANLSDEPVTISGAFLRPNMDNEVSVMNPTSLGSMAAKGFLRLTDLVGKLGGSEETGGVYLRATASGSGLPSKLVTATSYTFTPNDQGPGNYGQGIPAVPVGTDTAVAIAGVFQNSALRTNIGALNTSDATVTIKVTVRNANGVEVGTTTWTLQGYSQIQVSVSSLGISSLDGGSVTFERTSGVGSYRAYSSTVDQLTGDAIYNPAL